MANGTIMVQATAGGVAVAIAGLSTSAVTAATLIVATGGSAGLLLVGLGLYKMLSRSADSDRNLVVTET